MLKLKDFSVEHILDNVSTTFDIGKTYVVMGSNGVGKSTLSNALLGNPEYNVTQGDIFVNRKSKINRH